MYKLRTIILGCHLMCKLKKKDGSKQEMTENSLEK